MSINKNTYGTPLSASSYDTHSKKMSDHEWDEQPESITRL